MMAAARALLRLGAFRDLWLFDTFEGMPPPSANDVAFDNTTAAQLLATDAASRCEAAIREVRDVLLGTGYPEDRIHCVKGRVEDTIPGQGPPSIALLRLDTDWYESTWHEWVHLFPRLVRGGVVIIDDYGHWQGARKATDDYLAAHGIPLFLSRIDYTGRIGVKI